MLKTLGIFKITLRENLRGQLLWTSAIAGVVILILMGLLSAIALSHENRVIDVFSYFIADQLLLLIGIFSGASLCATDFSSRGIAELYIPAGVPRSHLLLSRLAAHTLVLGLLSVLLFAIKTLLLPQLADNLAATQWPVHGVMLMFSFCKACTALCVATFLGTMVRPLYATLGCLALFSFGHLTATFDTFLMTSSLHQAEAWVSPMNRFLYSLLKVWNPSILVVESVNGEWMMPTARRTASALLWASGFVLTTLSLSIFRVNKTDIRL